MRYVFLVNVIYNNLVTIKMYGRYMQNQNAN